MGHDRDGTGLPVTFRLDEGLGPNRAEVLLVMCRFSIALSGQFTVAVSEAAFQVTDVNITGAPFELDFAEDFPVRVTDLQVEQDSTAEASPGSLANLTGSDQFQIQGEVPIQIRMQVHFQGVAEWITFRTLFTIIGTIERNVINLTGRFAFRLEGYGDESMDAKFGVCEVILSASSLLRFQLLPNREANVMQLAFAERVAELRVGGSFVVGLDGLDIRVLELALTASPLRFAGLLSTKEIHVVLDRAAAPVSVDFTLGEKSGYHVQAAIPARVRTQLAFQGFTPKTFEAPLLLGLEGDATLLARLYLNLSEQIEVAIGDGVVRLEVKAQLEAEPTALAEGLVEAADGRRALYAALRTVPEGPFGRRLAPLRDALESSDRTTRLLAIGALGRRGGASVLPLLVSTLQDPAPEVRAAAATALGQLGGAAEATALLTSLERDADDGMRLATLLAIAALDAPTWLDATHMAIHDPNEVLRCQAALIIGRRGGVASAGPLLEALADPNPFVSLCAGMGLLAIGNEEAIETIARLAQENEDICVRTIGSVALGQTQHDKARHALQRMLQTNEDVFVRQAVLYALAKHEGGATSGLSGRNPRL